MATVEEIIRRLTFEGKSIGLDEAAAKLLSVAEAQNLTAVANDNSSRATLSSIRRWNELQRTLDPALRAQQDLARTLRQLDAAQAEANLTQERANQLASAAVARYQGLGTAAAGATKSVGALKAQTGNIAAQFQDIAVQLQGGQSPLTIALQQGSQLSAAFGSGGAAGAVKALGAGFMELLSPVNLATIATIAVGGAAVQWLMSLDTGLKTADDKLKAHEEWLRNILVGYDDVQKAAQKYIDAAKQLAQPVAMAQAQAQYATATKDAAEAWDRIVNSQVRLARGGDASVSQLAADVQAWMAAVDSGKMSVDDLQNRLLAIKSNDALSSTMRDFADKTLAAIANWRTLHGVAQSLASVIGGLSFPELPAGYQEAIAALKSIGKAPLTDLQQIEEQRNKGLSNAQDKGQRDQISAEANAAIERVRAQDAQKKAEEAAKRGVSAAAEQKKAYEGVTTSLQQQIAALGQSNREAYISQQLSQAKVASAGAEADAIRKLAGDYYDQKAAIEATQQAQQFFAETAYSTFQKLISGTESWNKALANLLSTLAEAVLRSALLGQGPLAGIFGTASDKGGVGGLFGQILTTVAGVHHQGGVAGQPSATRSVPAIVFANAPRYHSGGIAGVRSDEVPAILQRGERIIPVNQVQAAAANGQGIGTGGGRTEVLITLSSELVAQILKQAANQSVQIVQTQAPMAVAKAQLNNRRG